MTPSHRRGLRAALALALAGSLTLTGCLGPSYVIDRSEIARLERVPERARGARVRVVQRFSTATEPPPAAAWQAPVPAGAPPVAARRGASPAWTQVWMGPGSPTYDPIWAAPRVRHAGGRVRSAPLAGGPDTSDPTNGPSSSRSVGSGASSSPRTDAADMKTALVAAVVVGVAVGVGLAATEGARYDGWVAVHPQHPVHLMGAGDRHRVVPLSELRLSGLANDEQAVIVRHEGAGMWELGRAPLDREGVTYSFDIGQSRPPTLTGGFASLTGGSLRVGLYANRWLGILTGVDMAFGDFNSAAASVVTPHIQLVAIPLNLWRMHLGVFGETGWSAASFDALPNDQDPSGMRIAAGVIFQWEITTRLALDLRWTNQWLNRPGTLPTSSFTTGLSIY